MHVWLNVQEPLTPNMLLTQQQLTVSGVCELYLKWNEPAATPAHYNMSVTTYSLGQNNQPLYKQLMFNVSGVNMNSLRNNL